MTRDAAFPSLLRRLLCDRRGVSAALTALVMTVLLAGTGLSVDAGWWYTLRRQNQSAADAAALAAAYEVLNTACTAADTTKCNSAASAAATLNGYAGITPAVTYPYNNDATLVQVITQQAQNTWFAAISGVDSVTIKDRAVAQVAVLDNPCSYVLNPTAQKAFSIIGSAQMQSPSCSICVDSNASNSVYMQGATNSILQADSIITAGQISTTGQPQLDLNYPAQVGTSQPGCLDPYSTVLTHSFLTQGMPTTPCASPTTSGTTTTVGSNCTISGTSAQAPQHGTLDMSGNNEITGGWDIKNETVNLAPGTYWITGNLSLDSGSTLECTACVPGGAGVTIILTTNGTSQVGNVSQQSNAVIDSLNAPGSGTFENLLIQDSNGLPSGTAPSGSNTFQGTPGQTLDGLVYFPDTALTFQGNPTTGNNSCLLTVANTLTLQGNTTTMATTGCPPGGPAGVAGGVHKIMTVQLVQ
jgi:Flp pilus assembly protein TadG